MAWTTGLGEGEFQAWAPGSGSRLGAPALGGRHQVQDLAVRVEAPGVGHPEEEFALGEILGEAEFNPLRRFTPTRLPPALDRETAAPLGDVEGIARGRKTFAGE